MKQSKRGRQIAFLFLFLLGIFWIIPIIWLIFNSFKYDSDFITSFANLKGRWDYLDWLRILKKYGTACGVDEPLLKYRLSSTGKSGNKLHSAGMTYRVYRELGMGTFRSLYCFACYAVNGVRKYYGKGKKRGRG